MSIIRAYTSANTKAYVRAVIPNNGVAFQEYDVVIVGGGAGGVGAAYALKDSGLSVCLIDQNSMLGGTHTVGYVADFCPSPAPPFFDAVYAHLAASGKATVEGGVYERSYIHFWNPVTHAQTQIKIFFDKIAIAEKYASDLSALTIKLNTKFIEASTVIQTVEGDVTMNKCSTIKVQNLLTDEYEYISARFFIDSANGELIKSICTTEGMDYFIGTDAKTTYNEAVYPTGYAGGNRTDINELDFPFRIQNDPTDSEDETQYPYIDGTGAATGYYIEQDPTDTDYGILFTSTGGGISKSDFVNNGHDYTYQNSLTKPQSVWRKTKEANPAKYGLHKFSSYAGMLGIREGFRIACEYIIKQSDLFNVVRSTKDIATPEYIALSNWYCDAHSSVDVTVSDLNDIPVSVIGIPFKSLVPLRCKNVLVACKALGVSHIAQSAVRITKTMMSLGYAAGFAAKQFVDNSLTDVRNVDVPTLQTSIGLGTLISRVEALYQYNPYWNLMKNLVGVWEFDETSGTTAIDAFGENDGTVSGATINQTGKIGKCYDFDGVDDMVVLPITTHYTAMSFSAWIKPDGFGEANSGRLLDKMNSGGTISTVVSFYGKPGQSSGQISVIMEWTTRGQWAIPLDSIILGTWNHVVVTYDGASASNDPIIYINGVAIPVTETSTPSGSRVTNTDNYHIGNRGAGDRSFDGMIDQPALWYRVLTPAEVAILYHGGNGLAYSKW